MVVKKSSPWAKIIPYYLQEFLHPFFYSVRILYTWYPLQNFLAILKAEPDNVQANHNLCVVYVEKGDLLRAEKCLQHTLTLNPNADYVQNHLNIVRSRIQQIRQQQAQQKQQAQANQQQQQQQQQQANQQQNTPP